MLFVTTKRCAIVVYAATILRGPSVSPSICLPVRHALSWSVSKGYVYYQTFWSSDSPLHSNVLRLNIVVRIETVEVCAKFWTIMHSTFECFWMRFWGLCAQFFCKLSANYARIMLTIYPVNGLLFIKLLVHINTKIILKLIQMYRPNSTQSVEKIIIIAVI